MPALAAAAHAFAGYDCQRAGNHGAHHGIQVSSHVVSLLVGAAEIPPCGPSCRRSPPRSTKMGGPGEPSPRNPGLCLRRPVRRDHQIDRCRCGAASLVDVASPTARERGRNKKCPFLAARGKRFSQESPAREGPRRTAHGMELITHDQRERVPPLAGSMVSLPSVGQTPTPATRPAFDGGVESALALALIAGDSRAPQAAWVRYSPMVYGMLRRTFGTDHRVEDLIQDVFFILFRKVRGPARAQCAQGLRHLHHGDDDQV